MDNLTIFTNEFETLKGQFVISHDTVKRFIGIVEDQWDYYYVLYDGRKITFDTCLSRITALKGYIKDDDYAEMIRLAKINHFDQPDLWKNKSPEEIAEFNQKHKEEVLKFDDVTRFVLGPYWDII